MVEHLGSADHRLGRHAADIDASTADGSVANEGDIGAKLGGGNGRRKPGRARANDSEVIGAIRLRGRSATIGCGHQ